MKWTLDKAAKELGVHHETLAKGLVRAGLVVDRGSRFSTLEIFRGFQGDLKTEQTRKTRAEADAKELENRLRLGDIIEREAAQAILTARLAPLRAKLVAAPSSLASRLNPTDPELAKAVLEDWVRETLTAASQ